MHIRRLIGGAMSNLIISSKVMEVEMAVKQLTNFFGPIIADLGLEKAFLELLKLSNCYTCLDPESRSIGLEIVPGAATTEAQWRLLKILMIAGHIADMPSKALLNIAYTNDLQNEWKYQRCINERLARCFIVSCLNLEINPLAQESRQDMSQWDKNLCIQMAYRYRALWELIQVGWPYISNKFSDLPFNTDRELFCEIVRDERDYQFEMLTSSFLQVLTNDLKIFWDVMVNPERYEQLTLLLNNRKIYASKWLRKISPILVENSENNTRLRGRLKAHSLECEELAQLFKEALTARNSKGKIHKSQEWRHGERKAFHGNKSIQ